MQRRSGLALVSTGVLWVLCSSILMWLGRAALVLRQERVVDVTSRGLEQLFELMSWLNLASTLAMVVGVGIAALGAFRLPSRLARAGSLALALMVGTLLPQVGLALFPIDDPSAAQWQMFEALLVASAVAALLGWTLVVASLRQLRSGNALFAIAALVGATAFDVVAVTSPERVSEVFFGLHFLIDTVPLLAVLAVLRAAAVPAALPPEVLDDPASWQRVARGLRLIRTAALARIVVALGTGTTAIIAVQHSATSLVSFLVFCQAMTSVVALAGAVGIRRVPELATVRHAATAFAVLCAGYFVLELAQLHLLPALEVVPSGPAEIFLVRVASGMALVAGFLLAGAIGHLGERLGQRDLVVRSRGLVGGLSILCLGLIVVAPYLASLRDRPDTPTLVLFLSIAGAGFGILWWLHLLARLVGDLAAVIDDRSAEGGVPAARALR